MASSTTTFATSAFCLKLNKLISNKRKKWDVSPFNLLSDYPNMNIEIIPIDEDGDWCDLDAVEMSIEDIMSSQYKKVKIAEATHVINVYERHIGDYLQVYVK